MAELKLNEQLLGSFITERIDVAKQGASAAVPYVFGTGDKSRLRAGKILCSYLWSTSWVTKIVGTSRNLECGSFRQPCGNGWPV